uniref:Ionotropic glutamate receptor C-terminal domain-containing protein n=1 Tax=Trichogramma kaykai TaxID=54128 RepID=A0ABD2WT85_9HYME
MLASERPVIVIDYAELRNHNNGAAAAAAALPINDESGRDNTARINLLVLLLVGMEGDAARQLDASKRVLDRYADLAINATRPRVAVVGRRLDGRAAESLLLHAWRRKYLDVTLVDSLEGRVSYYVPFIERFVAFDYRGGDDVELFPDKFRHVANYTMNVLYTASNDQRVEAHRPLDFSLERFLQPATRMRFVARQVANFGEALEQLQEEENTFFPYLVQIAMAAPGTGLMFGRVAHNEWLTVVAKRRKRPKLGILKIGGFWSYGSLLVLVFVALRLAEFLMLGKGLHRWIDFFAVVIGQASSETQVSRRPTKKSLMILMLLMSIFYSSTLVSLVTHKLFGYEDVQISSYEELVKSGLQPYVYHQSVRYLVNGSDPWAAELRRIAVTFRPGFNCIASLAENDDDRVCFTSTSRARATERRLVGGRPYYEMFQLKVNEQPYGFMYEPASVFARHFDRLIQRGVEQHLQVCWACPLDDEDARNALLAVRHELESANSVDYYWLLAIVVVGLSSAALVFACELMIARPRRQRLVNNRQ